VRRRHHRPKVSTDRRVGGDPVSIRRLGGPSGGISEHSPDVEQSGHCLVGSDPVGIRRLGGLGGSTSKEIHSCPEESSV